MDLSSFKTEFHWYTDFGIRVTLTAYGHVETDQPYNYVMADSIFDSQGYRIAPPLAHPMWKQAHAALEDKMLREIGPLDQRMADLAFMNSDEGK